MITLANATTAKQVLFIFSDKTYLDKVRKIDIMNDPQDIEPNDVFHIKALSNSLHKSFSLIHGPPG